MRSRVSRAGVVSVAPEPALGQQVGLLLDALPEAVVTSDAAHRVTGWNRAAQRLFGFTGMTMTGASLLGFLPESLRSGSGANVKAALDGGETWTGSTVTRDPLGAAVELRFTAAPIGVPGAHKGYVIVARDISAQVRAEHAAHSAEARFSEFMAAAPALAFIKDEDGRYIFANQSTLRLTSDRIESGWLGKTDYDLWPPAVAAELRENDKLTLAGAVPREFIQIVPLADGPHTVLMHKFPLRTGTAASLLGGIGLDVTDLVLAQAELERGHVREAHASLLNRERALVAEALGHLRSSGTVEAIATSIARLVLSLPGLGVAAIILFELDGRATTVGLAHVPGSLPERYSIPLAQTRALRRRAQGVPWIEVATTSLGAPFDALLRAIGVGVLAHAPIQSGGDLLGVLIVGAGGSLGETVVTERLPAIVEYAGLTGALLGTRVGARRDDGRARRKIRAVIRRGEFEAVFQPIVELGSRTTVGYEALTRFRNGVAPEVNFSSAAMVGLGLELELATLGAALRDAARLPARLWLNVNVSPELILASDRLPGLLSGQGRPIVCEVTEHAAIEDYAAFLVATARLTDVRLAVDDAGAGFASFRHILELRPAFVKLDRSLVAGIDADPVRQALIVGMRHFAESAGCRLIAEGIETESELAALVELQIPLGQGYLLGEPVRAAGD